MKQRKSLWIVPFLFLSAAICSTPARADTVIASGGDVTAIDGIDIGGTLYNLTFSTTATPPPAGIPADLSSLETDLIGDLDSASIVTADGPYWLIILYEDSSHNDGIWNPDAYSPGSAWATDNAGAGYYCTPSSTPVTSNCYSIYGNFTTATTATPEPGSMPLTLTGLGLLGLIVVLRKRRAIVLSQAT